MTYDWYEIWVDESPTVPYVLFLISNPNGAGGIAVIDPKENDKVVHKSPDYESAKMWLLEDEYIQIVGRVTAGGFSDLSVPVAAQVNMAIDVAK